MDKEGNEAPYGQYAGKLDASGVEPAVFVAAIEPLLNELSGASTFVLDAAEAVSV